MKLPAQVTTPESLRPAFDTFSWQSFIALNWPADTSATRGTPQEPNNPKVFQQATAGGQPVVWGTYKQDFELFNQGDKRPTAWNESTGETTPCGTGKAGQRVFWRVTKGDTVIEAGNQAFSYPLIDQSLDYAVYEVRFNQAQYDFIRGSDSDPSSWLYLVKNLAAKEPLQMPTSSPPSTQGALMLKAAWKILDPSKDDVSRFYAVDALVLYPSDSDPKKVECRDLKVGLVGLHIVQKLKDFPEWVWSTFEQVDNVPAHGDPPGKRYSFNNGTDTPSTHNGYANRPPALAPQFQPKSQRKAVQVTRLNPIPDSTAALNAQYQQLLTGTVWQNYMLVFTQWPFNPQQFKTMEAGGIYPQDSGQAFPATGVTNSVMETYLQSQQDASGAGGNSCMSCHYRAGQADYSWTLMRRAH